MLEYYEQGLDIPDDVTLMFTDDNFGNIRRLPTKKERERSGGAGVNLIIFSPLWISVVLGANFADILPSRICWHPSRLQMVE